MKKSFIVETFDNFILFEPLFLGKKLKSHNKSQASLLTYSQIETATLKSNLIVIVCWWLEVAKK